MMKRFLLAAVITAVCATSVFATNLGGYYVWAAQGGNTVQTGPFISTTKVMKSWPLATITVYAAGTSTLSTGLYSDITGITPLANPFTADAHAYAAFFTAPGDFDVKVSDCSPSCGLTVPFTLQALRITTTSGVASTRLINTTSPITGGGDLSADRTIACPTCVTTALAFYQTVSNQNVGLTQRAILDFAGGSVMVAADNGNRTTVTFNVSPANAVNATGTNRLINTTSPITGGQDLTSDVTLGCATCVTTSRTITTTAPLTIDGGASADLSANRTLACPTCVKNTQTFTMGYGYGAISGSPDKCGGLLTNTIAIANGTILRWAYDCDFANIAAQLAANTVVPTVNGFIGQGVTADAFGTKLLWGDPTANRTVTLPDYTGLVALVTTDVLSTPAHMGAGGVELTNSTAGNPSGGGILFEGATADSNQTLLTVTDPTASRTITMPDMSGTVIVSGGTTQTISKGITVTGVGTFIQCSSGCEVITPEVTTAFGGTMTIDWSKGNSQGTALTANVTSLTFSNGLAGTWYSWRLVQSGGAWTVAWPGNVDWGNDVAPTLSGSGEQDIIQCYYDGTNYNCRAIEQSTGGIPTPTATGYGATGSVAMDTGSNNSAGIAIITTAGNGEAATGIVTITFSAAFGTNAPACTANLMDGNAVWQQGAVVRVQSASTSAAVFNWDNHTILGVGTNLTDAKTYKLSYNCTAK